MLELKGKNENLSGDSKAIQRTAKKNFLSKAAGNDTESA